MVYFVFGKALYDVIFCLPCVYCVIVVSRVCHALVIN